MPDWLLTYALLCLAAFAAGAVNSVAGGGTLLTFPVLNSVRPALTVLLANTTSTVALMPGSAAGAWGFRKELVGAGPWLRLLTPPSLVGGLVGSLLLTRLDPGYFRVLVPWLLLTASTLFLLQPTMAKLTRLNVHDVGLPRWEVQAAVVFFQFLVAVYGGYFGAGIGVLMLSALSFMGLGDIHRMNAVKTFLAACINFVSIGVFVYDDKVVWSYGLPMAVAGIAGGYTGARLGRRLPRPAVRWFVIVVGFGLSAWYFSQSGSSD